MSSTPKPAPIVFLHRGNSQHLLLALLQARKTNPGRELILIGDLKNQHLSRWVGATHILWDQHSGRAQAFAKHYRHASTNGAPFELVCIQRWMVLWEYLQTRPPNERRAIHLDSDVLVYADFSVIESQMAAYQMTIQCCGGHTCFINDSNCLDRLCAFIESHYTQAWGSGRIAEYRKKWFSVGNQPGNVSDMTFLLAFHLEHPHEVPDLTGPLAGGWALDLALDSTHGDFAMKDGIKDIRWEHGVPFVWHIPTAQDVRFLTLHFQGMSKSRMRSAATSLPVSSLSILMANTLRINAMRLVKKFTRENSLP